MLAHHISINSLIYLAVASPIVSFMFSSIRLNRKTALFSCIFVFSVASVVQLAFEIFKREPNYYAILQVNRLSTAFEIRQQYKKVSLKLHPDKNPSLTAEEEFQQAKFAYDVLMDESKRDIYNRFGPNSLDFDPRTDELKLIVGLGINYLYLIIISYISTIPRGGRACRNWIAIVVIVMLLVEVFYSLTETAIPSWMPNTLTEYELCGYLYSLFPGIVILLRSLSEYMYVDVDKCSLDVLQQTSTHNKALNGLLHQLQVLITPEERSGRSAPIETINEKILEIRDEMKQCNDAISDVVTALKGSSSNPGSNYYWLIFVFVYVGVYFFQ